MCNWRLHPVSFLMMRFIYTLTNGSQEQALRHSTHKNSLTGKKRGCAPALLNETSWVSLSRRLCFQPKHTHVPKPSGEPQEETRSVIPASADRKLHAWFSLWFLVGNSTDNVHKSIIRPLSALPFKKINLYDEAGTVRLQKAKRRLATEDFCPLLRSSAATEVNYKTHPG